MTAPTFRVVGVELFERDVALRLPFRFGVATLTACPQAFARVRIELSDGRSASGAAAELMVPKWFDKSPAKSNPENIADLRAALRAAADAYVGERTPRTAFGHFACHYRELLEAGQRRGINALTACYGPALLDRAALDAVCRVSNVSFYQAINSDLPGMAAGVSTLAPDLHGFDMRRFLEKLTAQDSVAARHTVGLVDPITAADVATRVDDGLPETLEEVIAAYGHRYFKLKVSGQHDADLDRLARIAEVLDRSPQPYLATLDGNEQYADAAAIEELWRSVASDPRLERFAASVLAIEQPLPRDVSREAPIERLARWKPVLIDESDATLDAFPQAKALGYTGVSTKSCKGFYKSLLNAARCVQWGQAAGYFMSAEDLTMQAGLGVQQDLALVSLLGLAHVERNGHHYVNGFAGSGAGEEEQRRFLAAHPGLYERSHGSVRLIIRNGQIDLGSLSVVGFASGAEPDWATLPRMASPLSAGP